MTHVSALTPAASQRLLNALDDRFALLLHQLAELLELGAVRLGADPAGDVGHQRPLEHPRIQHVQAEQARVELLGQGNGVLAGNIAVRGPVRADENAFDHGVILSDWA